MGHIVSDKCYPVTRGFLEFHLFGTCLQQAGSMFVKTKLPDKNWNTIGVQC
jgi:hypothetical protein